jgi:hypothetical protein
VIHTSCVIKVVIVCSWVCCFDSIAELIIAVYRIRREADAENHTLSAEDSDEHLPTILSTSNLLAESTAQVQLQTHRHRVSTSTHGLVPHNPHKTNSSFNQNYFYNSFSNVSSFFFFKDKPEEQQIGVGFPTILLYQHFCKDLAKATDCCRAFWEKVKQAQEMSSHTLTAEHLQKFKQHHHLQTSPQRQSLEVQIGFETASLDDESLPPLLSVVPYNEDSQASLVTGPNMSDKIAGLTYNNDDNDSVANHAGGTTSNENSNGVTPIRLNGLVPLRRDSNASAISYDGGVNYFTDTAEDTARESLYLGTQSGAGHAHTHGHHHFHFKHKVATPLRSSKIITDFFTYSSGDRNKGSNETSKASSTAETPRGDEKEKATSSKHGIYSLLRHKSEDTSRNSHGQSDGGVSSGSTARNGIHVVDEFNDADDEIVDHTSFGKRRNYNSTRKLLLLNRSDSLTHIIDSKDNVNAPKSPEPQNMNALHSRTTFIKKAIQMSTKEIAAPVAPSPTTGARSTVLVRSEKVPQLAKMSSRSDSNSPSNLPLQKNLPEVCGEPDVSGFRRATSMSVGSSLSMPAISSTNRAADGNMSSVSLLSPVPVKDKRKPEVSAKRLTIKTQNT